MKRVERCGTNAASLSAVGSANAGGEGSKVAYQYKSHNPQLERAETLLLDEAVPRGRNDSRSHKASRSPIPFQHHATTAIRRCLRAAPQHRHTSLLCPPASNPAPHLHTPRTHIPPPSPPPLRHTRSPTSAPSRRQPSTQPRTRASQPPARPPLPPTSTPTRTARTIWSSSLRTSSLTLRTLRGRRTRSPIRAWGLMSRAMSGGGRG